MAREKMLVMKIRKQTDKGEIRKRDIAFQVTSPETNSIRAGPTPKSKSVTLLL